MVASIGNATVSGDGSGAITFAHDNNGSTLLVFTMGEDAADSAVATYNGSNMTLVGTSYTPGTSGTGLSWAVYKHLTPTSGSNNVVANCVGNSLAIAVSIVGAGDITSFASASGNSDTPSATPASTTNDDIIVMGGSHYTTGTHTPGANQTTLGNNPHATGGFQIFASWQDGADGTAMTATMGSSNVWRCTSVSVSASGGAATIKRYTLTTLGVG